jgi:hypothetical protein
MEKIMRSFSRSRAVALLCAATASLLASSLLIAPSDARAADGARVKQFMKAEIRRERLKFWSRVFVGVYSSAGFTLGGSTKPDGSKTIHGFGLSCPFIDLETAQLPVTITDCAGSYVTSKPKPGAPSKTWTSFGDLSVTIKSYEGGVVNISFSGSIAPQAPNTAPPVTVTKGSAAIKLTDNGS